MKSPYSVVFELGYTIAIPVVVFAFTGRWLDGIFGTTPLLTAAGVLISMPVTGYLVYRKLKPFL